MKEDKGLLTFTITGLNVSLINALRRILIAEIPTIVFRTSPYEKNEATFHVNTTRLNNEILKQRLSCIPIHITENLSPEELAEYEVEIHKKNEGSNIEMITTEPGSDPGAVVHNACQVAQARNIDVVIVDTSGRMHTEHNLMAELGKIYRVVCKGIGEGSHEVLLVLDATTGQNGLAQAQAFAESVHLDGVILTKLDGSAKGGVGLAIVDLLGIPIRYVGVGEGLEDLVVFEPQAFVEALLLDPASGAI